jgi:dipeptidyl aminopeptidase/acylaminoacyl peptidase
MLREASPFFHVDKIKVPVLIAHGAKDSQVKISDIDDMVNALEDKGVDVTYMVKENEGHGFRNEENRIDFYTVLEKFLAKNLKGRAAK